MQKVKVYQPTTYFKEILWKTFFGSTMTRALFSAAGTLMAIRPPKDVSVT